MKKLYILPMIHTDVGRGGYYPKYLPGTGVAWAGIRWFGTDPPSYLIMADVTTGQDTQLGLQSDVISLPELANLDNQIGGALSQVQTKLEALNLPSEWVTSTFTYRQIIRLITAAMFLSQRARRLMGTTDPDGWNLFPAGMTLATRVNQLSPKRRQVLTQTLADLGVDTSNLDNASPMRAVIREVAQQKSAEFKLFLEKI